VRKEKTRVLSIDASTTTIGIAVLDHVGTKTKLVHHEYFKPSKKGSIFERLTGVKDYMRRLNDTWKPNVVCIEDIIQFMAGGSGAKTIIPLAVINRTIGLTWYEIMGKEPELLPVLRIRHAIKYSKELPPKDQIPEVVAQRLGIDFPYYKKINRRTKKEEICVESYDVADAIAVGLAHIIKTS
jgi:Holliday junction resolvasome RuvABC endonuclease subunit